MVNPQDPLTEKNLAKGILNQLLYNYIFVLRNVGCHIKIENRVLNWE